MRARRSLTGRAGLGWSAFLGVACLVLGALVVLLGLQNKSLKEALAAQGLARAQAPIERLETGEHLGDFDLETPDGPLAVRFGPRAPTTLLLVYAGGCSACPSAFPDWRELAPRFEQGGARVVVIRLDPGGAEEEELGLASGTIADAEQVPLAKLARVPLTAFVDRDGVVLWVRYGALDEDARAELAGFVGS